tara:strand:- start:1309 stop:1545 length:237 start_codon:yes stop_codon:yes gene_type:complete
MSNKMVLSADGEYEVYTETNDGENVYLEIQNPDYFEVSSMHLKIKVPLDKWVYLTENFLNIHKRHINIDDKQMELDLC